MRRHPPTVPQGVSRSGRVGNSPTGRPACFQALRPPSTWDTASHPADQRGRSAFQTDQLAFLTELRFEVWFHATRGMLEVWVELIDEHDLRGGVCPPSTIR